MKALTKYLIIIFTLLFIKNALAYEATTVGDAFSTNKSDACNQALEHARESAAQQARVFISSKYEKRIQLLSGEVVENVTNKTYQSTFGITKLVTIHKEKTDYDQKSGRINCAIEATFIVDMKAVTKELEARIRIEEVKLIEAEKRKEILNKIEKNNQKYSAIKEKEKKYKEINEEHKIICKSKYSMDECKDELIGKFKNNAIASIAKDLNIPGRYVSIEYGNFDGEITQKSFNEDESAFTFTMNGTFYYEANISDPYASENSILWRQLNGHQDVAMNNKSIALGENILGSNPAMHDKYDTFYVDIRLVGGDISGSYKTFLSINESAAYNKGLLDIGLIINFGNQYDANLFRFFYTTGKIILRQCILVSGSECSNDNSYKYDATGIGIDKIFIVNKKVEVALGAAYLTATRNDSQIETEFIQLQLGTSMFPFAVKDNKGFSLFIGIASLIPKTSEESFDINESLDLTIGLGSRW